MIAMKGSAAEVQSVASAPGNDDAAGVQPAAPSRAVRTYIPVRERNTLMTTVSEASMATPQPSDQCHSLDLDKVIANMRPAVHKAMRATLPDRYTPELAEAIAAHAIAELNRRYPSNAVRAQLNTSQCCARRPDRDPLTGDRLDGQEDTDESFRDRLLCTEQHGHDGDHRDALGRSWARDVDTAMIARVERDAEQIMAAISAPEVTA